MKAVINFLMIVVLFSCEIQANDSFSSYRDVNHDSQIETETAAIIQSEQNTTVTESESYENYTEKTTQAEQPKSGDSIGRKALVIAAVPVVIIGFVISAIVLIPVWAVKKVFGKDK